MEAFLFSRETGTSERSPKQQVSILYLGPERTDATSSSRRGQRVGIVESFRVFTKKFRGWVQDGCSQKRVTLLRGTLDRSGRMEMDLKALKDTPPWDWPAGMAEKLANVVRDQQAIGSDRLLATDMAGDFTVVNDELVEALLAMLRDSEESKQVRARAAISLGPILEYADTEGFDDAGDVPISKRTFQGIQESLRQLYMDAHIPKEVRRRILEASVRARRYSKHQRTARTSAYSGRPSARRQALRPKAGWGARSYGGFRTSLRGISQRQV